MSNASNWQLERRSRVSRYGEKRNLRGNRDKSKRHKSGILQFRKIQSRSGIDGVLPFIPQKVTKTDCHLG